MDLTRRIYIFHSSKESLDDSDGHGSLEFGLTKWKVQAVAAIKAGAEGARSIILKVYSYIVETCESFEPFGHALINMIFMF